MAEVTNLRGSKHAWAYLRANHSEFQVPYLTFKKWCECLLIPCSFQAGPHKMRHYLAKTLDKWWHDRQN